MKIVFLFENFDIGGVEKLYINLSEYFLKKFQEMKIYFLVENNKGELLEKVSSFTKPITFQKSYKKFNEIVKEINPDIIFATKGNLLKYPLYSKFVGGFKDFKLVASLHNPLKSQGFSFLTVIKRIIGAIILYRLTSLIITISESMKEEIINYTKIDNRKIKVIYNPVIKNDIEILSNEFIDIGYDYFIAVGRLHYQKGYDLMFKIFRRFLLKYPEYSNLKLIILGDGEEREKIEKLLKELNLKDNVVLQGAELNPYKFIRRAKALLLTSRYEGFPSVLIESSYLGVPFIAYDCKFGPNEIYKYLDWGYLVEYGNEEKFVKSMYNVVKNRFYNEKPDKKKFDIFNIDYSANEYFRVFKSLLNE
ncbi:MAG: glycosyltransferase [Elusimicrobiales bacterium]|nr:glycosyltransferase [Elusimicrobiales bacterium]